jgi:Fic family protein
MAVLMTRSNQKLALLDMLRQQTAPIKLAELLAKLGDHYSERTVRRWLAEWVKTGVVVKTGEKRGTHYSFADRVEQTTNLFFSNESQQVLRQVKRPYSLRSPISYNYEWLNNYKPNKDRLLSATICEELYLVGKRAQSHEPAGTYARQINQRLLIDLSYNSSRLEGNTYSLLETKELIVNGIDVPGKLDEEKTMILNHKEAIRFLIERPDGIVINETTILTLHYLLSDSLVSPQYSGKVRDHGVRISGSVYIPLENPIDLQNILVNICEKAALIKNPYEQSLFLLIHLAYLQGFIDVNKRTSRLAANIPLINHNLVPLSFNDISQEDYTDAMIAVYELNNSKPLIDLYRHSYSRTAALYDVTVESIGFDRIRVQYRQQRRQLIRIIILNKYKNKRLETYVNEIANELVRSEDKAHFIKNVHEDLMQLGPQTIAGLGISLDELQSWLDLE